jgi:hypothetical protein
MESRSERKYLEVKCAFADDSIHLLAVAMETAAIFFLHDPTTIRPA